MIFEEGQSFPGYEEFSRFLVDVEKSTFTKYYVRDSTSIERGRKRCPKRQFDEKLKYYELALACIHGSKFKAKGTGKRTEQR